MKIEILKEENKYLSHTMRELIRPSSFQQFKRASACCLLVRLYFLDYRYFALFM